MPVQSHGRRLTDAAGASHGPAGTDARIVSLVPSITELLVDLGLAPRLVGRTRYCIHPANAVAEIPAVGGTKKINMDRLRALSPTHVILNVDENTKAMADEIAAAGIETIVTHPLGPRDNPPLYRIMGGLFGAADRAERMCREFDAALARLEARARGLPARDVVYWIWKKPWMTVSRGTYAAEMLALVNWRTLCHDAATRYPRVMPDAALVEAADLFLFATEPFSFSEADLDSFALDFACPRGKCAIIDGSFTQWYGSRAIPALDYLGDFASRLARPDGDP